MLEQNISYAAVRTFDTVLGLTGHAIDLYEATRQLPWDQYRAKGLVVGRYTGLAIATLTLLLAAAVAQMIYWSTKAAIAFGQWCIRTMEYLAKVWEEDLKWYIWFSVNCAVRIVYGCALVVRCLAKQWFIGVRRFVLEQMGS